MHMSASGISPKPGNADSVRVERIFYLCQALIPSNALIGAWLVAVTVLLEQRDGRQCVFPQMGRDERTFARVGKTPPAWGGNLWNGVRGSLCVVGTLFDLRGEGL